MADVSSATTQIGSGTVTILDSTSATVASVSWDNTTGKITFHITGATDVQSAALAADGTFHRIVLGVSSGGVATWALDGAGQLTQSIAPGMLKLQLGATFGTGTAWPAFYFDNVSVTSP